MTFQSESPGVTKDKSILVTGFEPMIYETT